MLLIIGAWIFLFIILSLLGHIFCNYIGRIVVVNRKNIFLYFWIGLSVAISFLQIYSIFYKINYFPLFLLMIASLLYVFIERHRIFRRIRTFWFDVINKKNILPISLSVLLVIFLSYSASKNVVWYDTNLYHLNAVRWLADYGVVPGLANLHIRLGFNSGFFLLGALVDTWIFTSSSSHIALSLLLFVLTLQWIYIIFKKEEFSYQKIFVLITFPYLLMKSWSIEAASLSTDLSMTIIFFALNTYLLDDIDEKSLIIITLAALAFIFKMNALFLLPFSLLFLLKEVKSINSNKIQYIFSFLFLPASLLLGYIARNSLLSGWLIFPFKYGNLGFRWSVPKENVFKIINIIKGWGRSPGAGYEWTLNTDWWGWFIPWMEKHQLGLELTLLFVSVVSIIVVVGLKKIIKKQSDSSKYFIPVFMSLASIILFIYSAPLMRFGQPFFWSLLGVSVGPIIIWLVNKNKLALYLLYIFIFVFTINIAGNGPSLSEQPRLFDIRKEKSANVYSFVASPEGEYPPLIVWIPKKGDKCENSQLPCTTRETILKQLIPGDIGGGFISAD